MKNLYILLTTMLFLYLCSCNDDEIANIDPSLSQIEMEGEGGEVELSFTYPNWKIARINVGKNNLPVWGSTYFLDGSLIDEHGVLSLDSLGKMDSKLTGKGFSITRGSYTSLKVSVDENSTGEDFKFTILLKSGNESKEIEVNQKKSQGYSFKSIDYKKDKDSRFVRSGGVSFSHDIAEPQELILQPFKLTDMYKKSMIFKSSDKDAFVWTDSVMVDVPSDMLNGELYIDGKLYVGGKKRRYTAALQESESELAECKCTVKIPKGRSSFSIDILYRKREVFYSLCLINNRTGKEKVINGKWIEEAPVDYIINWKK